MLTITGGCHSSPAFKPEKNSNEILKQAAATMNVHCYDATNIIIQLA